jgi:hypothetical protein
MEDMIRYLGVMTLGTFSIPLALGLGWLTLRGIFDLMPHRAASARTGVRLTPAAARR